MERVEKSKVAEVPLEYVTRIRSGGEAAPSITPIVISWLLQIGMLTGLCGIEVRYPPVLVATFRFGDER